MKNTPLYLLISLIRDECRIIKGKSRKNENDYDLEGNHIRSDVL